ncbi:Phage tail fiber protein [Weissella confusa]|uniref:hypothetical protein n=1 Tax=Weissella confusa TaxID=1583 RepID=UPI000989A41A|nr:hypothetical protein [Weissella confusa]SJX67733.1 Phage tail fiber protein [Weissella confusa]
MMVRNYGKFLMLFSVATLVASPVTQQTMTLVSDSYQNATVHADTVASTIKSGSQSKTGATYTQLKQTTSLLSYFGLSSSDITSDGKSLTTGVFAPGGSVINDGSTQANAGVDKNKVAAATLFKALMTESNDKAGKSLLGSVRSDGSIVTYANVTLNDMQNLSKFSIADTVRPVATKIEGATAAPFYNITFPTTYAGQPNGNGVTEAINQLGSGFWGVYDDTAWSSVPERPQWGNYGSGNIAAIAALAHAATNITQLDLSGINARFNGYSNYASAVYQQFDTSQATYKNLQVLRLANNNGGDQLSSGQSWDILGKNGPASNLTTIDLSGNQMGNFNSGATVLFSAMPKLQNFNIGYNPKIDSWPQELSDAGTSGSLIKNLQSLITDYTGYQEVPKWAIQASKQGLLVLSMLGNPLTINSEDVQLLKNPSSIEYMNLTGNTTKDEPGGYSTKIMYVDNSTASAVQTVNNILSNPVSQMLIANDPDGELATQVKNLTNEIARKAKVSEEAADYQKLLQSADLIGSGNASVAVDVTLTTLSINGQTYNVKVPYTTDEARLASDFNADGTEKTDAQKKTDDDKLAAMLHQDAVKLLPEQVPAIKTALDSGQISQNELDNNTTVSNYVAPLTQEELMQYYAKHSDDVDQATGKTYGEIATSMKEKIQANPDSAFTTVQYLDLPAAPQASTSVDTYYQAATANVQTQLTNLSTSTDYTITQLSSVKDALAKAGADTSDIDASIAKLKDTKNTVESIIQGAAINGSTYDYFYARSQTLLATNEVATTTATAVDQVHESVTENKDALEEAGFDTSALTESVMDKADKLIDAAVNGKTFTQEMADAVKNGPTAFVDGTEIQGLVKPDTITDLLDNITALEKQTDSSGKAFLQSSTVTQLVTDLSNLGQVVLNTVTKDKAADLAAETVAKVTGKDIADVKTDAKEIASAIKDNNMGTVDTSGTVDTTTVDKVVNVSQSQNGNKTAVVDDPKPDDSTTKPDDSTTKPDDSATKPGDSTSDNQPEATLQTAIIDTMKGATAKIGDNNLTSGTGKFGISLTDARKIRSNITIGAQMTKPFTYSDGNVMKSAKVMLGSNETAGTSIKATDFYDLFSGTTTKNGVVMQKALTLDATDATGQQVASGTPDNGDQFDVFFDHMYVSDSDASEMQIGSATAEVTWTISSGVANN